VILDLNLFCGSHKYNESKKETKMHTEKDKKLYVDVHISFINRSRDLLPSHSVLCLALPSAMPYSTFFQRHQCSLTYHDNPTQTQSMKVTRSLNYVQEFEEQVHTIDTITVVMSCHFQQQE